MSDKNSQVDKFIEESESWKQEFGALRKIALDCSLKEELKWGKPSYTHDGRNVLIIHGFKEYCAVLFPKGSLMKDPENMLVQQTKNVQAARQIRFTRLQEINDLATVIKDYILEAVEVEKKGLKVAFKGVSEFETAAEFQRELDRNSALKEAFEALTPGRQKGYLLFFSQPKQSKTRQSRVEASIPRILDGLGINDR